jgi:hypothetical protein
MQESSKGSANDLEMLDWISDQLTILAEAFGEQLTQERAEIYLGGLADIPRDKLRIAFLKARYERTFFPRLAELRSFAGSSAEEEKKVEAQAAWQFVNEYLRKWGVDRQPIRSNGKWIKAPPLEPRLDYALRRIGGLWRLNQITDQTYDFIFRDFCEAYALAPAAELKATQFLEKFKAMELTGEANQHTDSYMHKSHSGKALDEKTERPVTGELTIERKAELRQKLSEELTKQGLPGSAGGL